MTKNSFWIKNRIILLLFEPVFLVLKPDFMHFEKGLLIAPSRDPRPGPTKLNDVY